VKYINQPPSSNGARVYVLGAREGSGKIGEAVADRFAGAGFYVVGDDGANGDGSRPPGGNLPNDEVAERFGYTVTEKGRYQRFDVPAVDAFERANPDTLVITLGKTYKGHFAEIADWEINNLIRANLVLPLEAARRFVQATRTTSSSSAPMPTTTRSRTEPCTALPRPGSTWPPGPSAGN
jgi:nucleoside-diphosphate-sugar epimerase